MNSLQLRYAITEDRVTLRPYIDSDDLLGHYRNDQGLDPDRLLPPLSSRLLPSRVGHTALVGVCSCGETGCGSLSIRLWRVGNEVAWDPDKSSGHETLSRGYRFDLTHYLDAVDGAAEDPPPGEGLGRRAARTVRMHLDGYEQTYGLHIFGGDGLDWVSAWPWTSDTVKASLSNRNGQTVHDFSAKPGETEHEFATRVASEIRLLMQRA
jgi:hypothetical protein